MQGKLELSMLQIKADLFLAKAAIEEAERLTPKAAKYMKGQAGYHLQQAAEKMIKIQLYRSNQTIDPAKVYKHKIYELIAYANTIQVNLVMPAYVDKYAAVISGWEAEGRYDIHVVVRIDQLKKCYGELQTWYQQLEQADF